MRTAKGFTLLEMLAATVIMSIIITVVLAPLTELFRNTNVNTQRLQETTQAQNILEYVKGQWKPYPRVINDTLANTSVDYRLDLNRSLRLESRRRYDSTCYDATGLNAPSGTTYTVTVNTVDRDGTVGAVQPLVSSTNCASATVNTSVVPPPMKQVTVTVNSPKNQKTVLSAIVARP